MLKLQYPGHATWGGDQANVWKQTSNPVTRTDAGVEGYEPVDVIWSMNEWGGLGRSVSLNYAFLDGSTTTSKWFYAIGMESFAGLESSPSPGAGMPGPATPLDVQMVELYVCPGHDRCALTSVQTSTASLVLTSSSPTPTPSTSSALTPVQTSTASLVSTSSSTSSPPSTSGALSTPLYSSTPVVTTIPTTIQSGTDTTTRAPSAPSSTSSTQTTPIIQVVASPTPALTSTPSPRVFFSIELRFDVFKSYIVERKGLVELAITNVLKPFNITAQVTLTGVEEVETARRQLLAGCVAVIEVQTAKDAEPIAREHLTLENINKELGALGLPTAVFDASGTTTTTPVPVTTPLPSKLTADAGKEAASLVTSIVGGSIAAVTASVVVSTVASVTASSAAAAGGAAAGAAAGGAGAGAGAGAGGTSAGGAAGGAAGAGPLISMIGQVRLVPLPRSSSTSLPSPLSSCAHCFARP